MCSEGCLSCDNEESCTQCDDELVLLNGFCEYNCGYYNYLDADDRTCKSCISHCWECENATECIVCDTGYN